YRAKYDRQPRPPPHHTPGRSRVTVHEDTDGDGAYDTHKVFADKLGLANAALPGRDGVWVMHTPHLLFYPDRNADDIPDGDPVVHLAGFGFEDTHSVANGITWGPDGWLYGAQGSTVSCRVTRPGIDPASAPGVHFEGCMVWRYHPKSREFEIFAEGGGNVFGLEFDADGRLFSGHNGGGTRGFHYVQGGLYLKQGKSPGKFGPPDNPFAFGELPMMPGGSIPRFSHNVIAVNGSAMPDAWQGRLLGADPLHRHLVLSERSVRGASFTTRDIGFPVKNSDVAFRPVYMANAPDGSLLIADFYERYIAHGQHYQSQIDPTSGRVYRLRAKIKPLIADTNLSAKTDGQLIGLLAHPNKWHRQTAVRLLGQRATAVTNAKLRKQIKAETGRAALHGLWALHQAGGLDDALAAELLWHSYPHVRAWAVRLRGDERKLSAGFFDAVRRLAKREGHPEVRSQIAGTAIRLPRNQALGLAAELLRRTADVDDPFIPMQCWWVLERHCEGDRGAVLELFRDVSFFRQPMVERHILERLMRRLAARGRQDDFIGCAGLLKNAPTKLHRDKLMVGFSKALEGQALPRLPEELLEQLRDLDNPPLVLRVRLGDSAALGQAQSVIADTAKPAKDRVELIRATSDAGAEGLQQSLLSLVQHESNASVLSAGLLALQRFTDDSLGQSVVKRYASFPKAAKPAAISFLASRPAWSRRLLAAVESGRLAKRDVPLPTVEVLLGHGVEVAAQAGQLWPGAGQAATGQAAEVARVRAVVEGRPGSPYRGRELFMQRCAACHKLFHKGGEVGPNLTHYQRDDLDTLLPGILDPSREIREGFEQMHVQTRDGRLLSGFLADRTDKLLILRGIDGGDMVIEQSQVESAKVSPRSLMPEGLLAGLSDQQLRDFFAYLRIAQPIRN
ncbi:MAG: c-type cytochrome, partial [Verrucomicrobia bacterium]|nr:c-type cytochrome [Verrucomicrobiota bacterium]